MDLIMSHRVDPDGVVSAAFLAYVSGLTKKPYEIVFADYPDLAQRTREVCARQDFSNLFLADLNLVESSVSDEDLDGISSHARIYYFDHHRLTPRREAKLRSLSELFLHSLGKTCAARMIRGVYQDIGSLNSANAKLLADVAQAKDHPKTEFGSDTEQVRGLARELDYAIKPQGGLELLIIAQVLRDSIDGQDEWQRDFHLVGALRGAYEKVGDYIARVAVPNLERSVTYHTITIGEQKIEVACTPAEQILYMKEGVVALKRAVKGRAKLLAVFYEEGNVIVDYPKDDIPLLSYLTSKGGGGRSKAGGGYIIKEPVDAQNYARHRDEFLRSFEEFANTAKDQTKDAQ